MPPLGAGGRNRPLGIREVGGGRSGKVCGRSLAATVVVFPPSLMAAAAVLSMAPFPGVTPASAVVAP
jgi:hypothetical protein